MKLLLTILISVLLSGLYAQDTGEYSTVIIGEIVPHTIEKHRFNESGDLENYQSELFLTVIDNESLDTSRIANQKALKPIDEKRILTLLLEKKAEGERFWSDCYIPRHYISFLLDSEIVGFIEICFECAKIKTFGICADWSIDLRQEDFALLEQYMNSVSKE